MGHAFLKKNGSIQLRQMWILCGEILERQMLIYNGGGCSRAECGAAQHHALPPCSGIHRKRCVAVNLNQIDSRSSWISISNADGCESERS